MSLKRVAAKSLMLFFITQLLLGVFFVSKSYFGGQDSLHQSMLKQKAGYFLLQYLDNPLISLPNENDFKVFKGKAQLPNNLIDKFGSLAPGYYNFDVVELGESEEERELQLMIQSFGDESEYFYFLSDLDEPQEWLTVIANISGLLVAYILSAIVLAGVLSRIFLSRLLTPLRYMVRKVQRFDGDAKPSDFSKTFNDGELGVLAHALDDMSLRIAHFVERERNITRNISHELRTPITVLKSTLEIITLLSQRQDNGLLISPDHMRKLQTSCNDLQAMIEAILWLGREDQANEEEINCADLVDKALLDLAHLYQAKPIEMKLALDQSVTTKCMEKLFFIAVSNLLRNAFNYTESGKICVSLKQGMLTVEDTGVGIDNATSNIQSFGLGLNLVQQVCQRMGWSLKLESVGNGGQGTRAVLRF